MPSQKIIVVEGNWRIKLDGEPRLFVKGECLAKNASEIRKVYQALLKHVNKRKKTGRQRCVSILNPHTMTLVNLHKQEQLAFLRFLKYAEVELSFLRELSDQCKLDKEPSDSIKHDWYFTLN
jgi:hypothetical protein